MSAVDVPALSLAIGITAVITAVIAFFGSAGTRRDWIMAGVMALVIMAIGIIDLLTEKPRETHMATAVIGSLVPVAGAMGLSHAMRRARPWVRWLTVFLLTFALLIAGLLIGASILPRYLDG